ncbi:MAG: hypothetical protein WKF83_16850 [Nocardioidaceae bacterium]
MEFPDQVEFIGDGELVQGEGADGLQHVDPRLTIACFGDHHQARIDELG